MNFFKKTNYTILSLDNYSSGSKKNHIKNKRVKYINGNTVDIDKIIKNQRPLIQFFILVNFQEYIKAFLKMNECLKSNTIGSNAVFNFCLKNRIKLIYSATSASLGNQGKDKNLISICFYKSKKFRILENLKKWFNFKYEVIYFYNVYGP